jgi:hypothetical protein
MSPMSENYCGSESVSPILILGMNLFLSLTIKVWLGLPYVVYIVKSDSEKRTWWRKGKRPRWENFFSNISSCWLGAYYVKFVQFGRLFLRAQKASRES